MRNGRFGEVIIHEPVNLIDRMAHPLIGNAAGKFFVQAELEIDSGIEGTRGLGQKPLIPVCILFPDLLHLGTAAPAGAVIVPDDLHLADITESATSCYVMGSDLVRFAPVLGSNLNNSLSLNHGIPCRF